jgi:hypothetical protein
MVTPETETFPQLHDGESMATWYRLRARESDTRIERISFLSCADDVAKAAELWASDYYGDEGATWIKPTGSGRYLVGRLYNDGFREPGTCVISVEPCDDEDRDPA